MPGIVFGIIRFGREGNNSETVSMTIQFDESCSFYITGVNNEGLREIHESTGVVVEFREPPPHIRTRVMIMTISGTMYQVHSAVSMISDKMSLYFTEIDMDPCSKKLNKIFGVFFGAPNTVNLTIDHNIWRARNGIEISFPIAWETERSVRRCVFERPVINSSFFFKKYPLFSAHFSHYEVSKENPIAAQAWPYILKGQNVFINSKTYIDSATYVPPLLYVTKDHLNRIGDSHNESIAIIVAPEYKHQNIVEMIEECNTFDFPVYLANGKNVFADIATITGGKRILVLTASTMMTLMAMGGIKISFLCILVVDEVESIQKDFNVIFKMLPKKAQIVVTSTRLACLGMFYENIKHPVKIEENPRNVDLLDYCSNISYVSPGQKQKCLFDEISRRNENCTVLIFCKNAARVESVVQMLHIEERNVFNVRGVHEDTPLEDRDKVFESIRNGSSKILIMSIKIAHDLYLKKFHTVIINDFPNDIERYLQLCARCTKGHLAYIDKDNSMSIHKNIYRMLMYTRDYFS